MLSRGNERKDIFHDDRDRLTFLDAISEMADNYNEESGHLFGMTYSVVSHILSSMRARMQKDSNLRVKFNYIYSLCKM